MKKILIILMLVLFLGACTFTNQRTPTSTEFRTGNDGLVFEFGENSPPASIFEDSLFNIILHLENKGGSNIDNAVYSISYPDQYVSLTDDFGYFQLRGKESGIGVGQQERFTFSSRSLSLDPQLQRLPVTISASACYDFETIGTAQVCVDTDLEGARTNKPCNVRSVGLSGGQGAPVSITNVVPLMLPHQNRNRVEPQFTITLSNVGGGQIFEQGNVEAACGAGSLPATSWNKATVSAFLANRQMDCGSSGITFKSNRAEVICSLPDGIDKAQGAFTSPLRVEVDYGYTTTISANVELKKQI